MSDFRKTHETIQMGSDRSFGLVFFAFFGLLGLYPLLKSNPIRTPFVALAVVFLVIALLFPRMLHPLNWLWMRFAVILSKFMNPLIMGVLFFAVVTPIGLFMRAIGKDLLNLRFEENAESYWIKRDPPGPPPESMPLQF